MSKAMNEGRFLFNASAGRFCIGKHDLHCGECFELFHNGEWKSVRIEMADFGWYLVGLSGKAMHYDGSKARL